MAGNCSTVSSPLPCAYCRWSGLVWLPFRLSGPRAWRKNTMNLRNIVAQALLSLAFIASAAAGNGSDIHKDFHVTLSDPKRTFPEPLAPGEQPGFKFRGTKGWAWTPEQYLAEIPYLVKFKMNFLMNCYSSMFDLEHYAGWAQANRWWEDLPDAKKKAYEKVVRECQNNGIQFCFSMNPNIAGKRMV